MSEENPFSGLKIERVEWTPKQQDRLMHKKWKKNITRLQNSLHRRYLTILKQKEIISGLKKFLRFQKNCKHIYIVFGSKNLVYKCDNDMKLCKFQCGVLEAKKKGE